MECSEIKRLLSEYADGALDARSKADVEVHLGACKACSAELVSLKAYLGEMGSLQKIKAPEDFLKKVRERLQRRSEFEKMMRMLFVPARIKVPLEAVVVAACVILAINIYRGITARPIPQFAQAPLPVAVMPSGQIKIAKAMPKEIPAKEAIPEVQKAIPEIQEGLPGAKEAIPEAKATLPEVKEAISEVTTAPPEVPVIKPVIKEEPPQTPSQQGPIRLALLIKPHAAPTAEDAAKVTQEGYQDRRVVGFETRAGAKSGINGEVPVLRLPVRPKDKKETPPEPLNAAMAELRGLVEKAEGKVIEVKYNNDTGLPQSLRAVIPSGRYKGFVLSLVLVGSFNEGAAVGEAAARQGPVTVDIDLISADK